MIIGCVKEIKKHEYRVGVTPASVSEYIREGHTFLIEAGAGVGSGYRDEEYESVGAQIVAEAEDVWERVDMMIKVKEPLESEYDYFKAGLILYTYVHLAANLPLCTALMAAGVTSVAYETLEDRGGLPLLKPMSEVAGRLAVQEGAKYLEKPLGGKGVLLAGVPGVHKGNVVIVGGGVVGANAARVALGMGAHVSILDRSIERLEYLDFTFNGALQTIYSTPYSIERACVTADVVIGAVLIPGAMTPKLIKKSYLAKMEPGSVIVDVAVDQGGCCETTHATYHDDPIYVVDGVVHYCVANMPGAVARTATMALCNATLHYGLQIAKAGIKAAIKSSHSIATAINVYGGQVTYLGVAEALSLPYHEILSLI